ncbi:metabotropic glutamate receptor 3-like [Glandiceps talaboti]
MFPMYGIYCLFVLQLSPILIHANNHGDLIDVTHPAWLTYVENSHVDEKVAYEPGVVVFGGLFAIHIPGENGRVTCGSIQQLAGLWVESMLYAVQNVNLRDDILPKVKIGYDIKDDCSDPNIALEHALSFVNADGRESCTCSDCDDVGPPTVGVVGTGSSTTSIAVADLLGLFQIPQVSYSASSPLLSDKMRFPFFLRTLASDINQAKVMAALTTHYDWNYVIIVHTEDDYGIPGMEALKTELKHLNVCISSVYELSRHTTEKEVVDIVKGMKEMNKAEVIFTFCLKHDISRILDEAVKQDLRGRTWIASDSWGDSMQTVNTGGREVILEGMLGIAPKGGIDKNFTKHLYNLKANNNTKNPWFKDTLGNLNNCTFDTDVPNMKRCQGDETYADVYQEQSDGQRSAFMIDAVYTLAYGLHDYLECTNDHCNLTKIDNMDMEMYLHSIRNVTFAGHEEFYFDKDGEPVAKYEILNLQHDSVSSHVFFNKVGDWSTTYGLNVNRDIHWSSGNQSPASRCSPDCVPGYFKVTENPSCCWKCEECQENSISNMVNSATCTVCENGQRTNINQTECITLPVDFVYLDDPVAIAFNITAGLCLLATAIVFFIFVKHNETPIVKATSVELSYCLLACIALCYANVCLILQKPSDFVCNAVVNSVGISFAAFVGTLITKTNRISRIFNRRLSAGSPSYLSIKYQMLIIASIVGVQIIIQVLWVWIEPGYLHPNYSNPMFTVLECNYGTYAGPMATVVYVLILALYCSYLAFRIRKLPGQFNDSKAIFFSILTTGLVWLSFFPAYFKSGNKMRIIVCSLALILNSTIALSSLFIPKLFIILFKPEKNRRESTFDLKDGYRAKVSVGNANFSRVQGDVGSSSGILTADGHITENTPLASNTDSDLDEETFQKQLEDIQKQLSVAEDRKFNALSRVAELKRILEELEKDCGSIHEL